MGMERQTWQFASQSSDVGDHSVGQRLMAPSKGTSSIRVASVSNNVNFMAAADLNGDGALDMALADFWEWRSLRVRQPPPSRLSPLVS